MPSKNGAVEKKKPARKAKKAAPSEPEAKLSKLFAFEPMEVHRRDIKTAEYNPRTIKDESRADLGRAIDKFGLVEPLVFNKRTGNLVGGHQRLKKIDKEEANDNYLLRVAVIDVDLKTEKELNIALNNPNIQGDYDLAKLGEMFRSQDIDVASTGFSPAQIYQMFGDNACVDQPEQTEEAAKAMSEARERYNRIKEAAGKRDDFDYYLVVFDGLEGRLDFQRQSGVAIKETLLGATLARYMNGAELRLAFLRLANRVIQLEDAMAAGGVPIPVESDDVGDAPPGPIQ